MEHIYSIRDIENELGVAKHRIDYALHSLKVCKPRYFFAGRRVFAYEDIEKLRLHFARINQEPVH